MGRELCTRERGRIHLGRRTAEGGCAYMICGGGRQQIPHRACAQFGMTNIWRFRRSRGLSSPGFRSPDELFLAGSNPVDDSVRTQDARELGDVVRVRERF
jgi:hypothetical protein